MAKLIKVAGGTNGTVSYTLAPGESWQLDAVVFEVTAAGHFQTLVPTLIARSQDGHVLVRVTAPAIST